MLVIPVEVGVTFINLFWLLFMKQGFFIPEIYWNIICQHGIGQEAGATDTTGAGNEDKR